MLDYKPLTLDSLEPSSSPEKLSELRSAHSAQLSRALNPALKGRGSVGQQLLSMSLKAEQHPASRTQELRVARRAQFLELLRRHNASHPSLEGQVRSFSRVPCRIDG